MCVLQPIRQACEHMRKLSKRQSFGVYGKHHQTRRWGVRAVKLCFLRLVPAGHQFVFPKLQQPRGTVKHWCARNPGQKWPKNHPRYPTPGWKPTSSPYVARPEWLSNDCKGFEDVRWALVWWLCCIELRNVPFQDPESRTQRPKRTWYLTEVVNFYYFS